MCCQHVISIAIDRNKISQINLVIQEIILGFGRRIVKVLPQVIFNIVTSIGIEYVIPGIEGK